MEKSTRPAVLPKEDGNGAGGGRRQIPSKSRKGTAASCTSSGKASTPKTNKVKNQGERGSTVQPNTSNTMNASGNRLRRRLSSTFQRASRGRGLGLVVPPGPGTRGKSQR